ncbi:MAG: DUF1580 domain-containing protein [Planctomycetota bacterium]
MIDLSRERIIALCDVPRRLPGRKGKRPHISTVCRWASRGCKGVRLETAQIGGTKVTSAEKLQLFVDQLTAAAEVEVCGSAPGSGGGQQTEIRSVERRLDAAGI